MRPSLHKKPGIDLLLPEERESLQKEQPGSSADTKKQESSAPAPKPRSSVPERIAGKTTPKPAVLHPAENMFVEDLTSIPEEAHWNCVRKGKIHVLEIFAGSARFSQCCALSGLEVGTPVDIRTGFDAMTSKGRHMVMEIIREQAPDVILMAPVCGPWSNMQNIQQDQQKVGEKRRRYLPMVEFVASIARYQLKQKILHYRKSSDIQDMVSEMHATIAFRPIRDLGRFPFLCIRESGLRSLKPTSLMHCLPSEVMRPIFRRCKNFPAQSSMNTNP